MAKARGFSRCGVEVTTSKLRQNFKTLSKFGVTQESIPECPELVDTSQSLGGHCRSMAKLDKLADRNGFDGIRYAVKVSEFDQHDFIAQLIHNSANLSFGEVRCRNIF